MPNLRKSSIAVFKTLLLTNDCDNRNYSGMTSTQSKYLQPAADVINALGADVISAELGLDYSTVHRWRLPRGPKGKSGTGGTIPFKYHNQIIALGAKINKPIPPEMFLIPGSKQAAACMEAA